jgi:hypothetical protein
LFSGQPCRTVIMTRMTRPHWCLPCTGVARAVVRARNHIRRGTIELSHAPSVKRTPPTLSFDCPAPQRYHCLLPPQRILRLGLTPASTHSHPIPHRSINTSPKVGSLMQVKRVHHPSRTTIHPLPVGAGVLSRVEPLSPTRLS